MNPLVDLLLALVGQAIQAAKAAGATDEQIAAVRAQNEAANLDLNAADKAADARSAAKGTP